MRINEIHSTGKVSPAKKKTSNNSGGDFSTMIEPNEEPTAVSSASSVQPLSSIDGLLAAQEINIEEETKKQQIAHGNHLLDYLEDIRDGLLLGSINVQQVQNLVAEVRKEYGTITDPALQDIIREIEIRAEVEIAKLEMARAKS